MKKIISVFLALVLTMSLTVPAFAADPIDPKFTFDLTAVGDYPNPHDIEVETNDIVTVLYSLSADTGDGCYALTQDEIYYDTSFFEFVADSVKLEEGVDGVDIGHHERLDKKWYVFFNNGSSKYFDNDPEYAPIGSFQLKVIATTGSSTIQSTNFGAKTPGNIPYKQENFDLKVTIKGSKEDADVTVTAPSAKTYGDGTFTVSASAAALGTGTQTWSWASSDPTALKILSGGNTATPTIQILKADTTGVTLTASYSSDTHADSASATIVINKAVLTPSVNTVADKEYNGDTTGSGTIKLSGAKNGDAPEATGTFAWTAKDAGTNKVNVTGIALTGDWGNNYALSTDELSNQAAGKSIAAKVLTKADLEYTGAAITKTYDGDTSCSLTSVSVKAASLIAGDSLTVNGTAVYNDADVVDANKVTFTPTAITTGNYTLAASETLDIDATITKATQTPSITSTATLCKGGNELDLSELVSNSFGDLSFEITFGDAATLEDGSTLKSADKTGTVKITVTAEGDANHEPYTGANDAITVTVSDKADAGVSFTAPESKTYGDADFTIKATVTTAGTNGTWTWTSSDPTILEIVKGDTDTVKVKVLKADATGATLTAKYESDTTAGSSTSAAIPVVPKTVSLSWYQESSFTNQYSSAYTYNSSEQGVYAKVTNAVSGDDVTVSTITGNTATDANASDQSYTATATVLGGDDAANYTLTGGSNISKSWKINPRNISGATITLGTALTYTGGEQTQTVTGVALTNPDLTLTTSDYTVSDNKGTNVKTNGDYTLTVTGTGNYTGTATKAWNIAKATDNAISGLAITGWTYDQYNAMTNAPSATAKYGTPTFTYFIDEECTMPTTTANSGATSAGAVPVNAGTYYVKASVAGTANYNEASDSTSFTIDKANYTTSVSGKTVNVFYGKTDATTVTLNDITGTLPTGAAIKSVAKGTDTNNIIGEITGADFKLNQDPALTGEDVDKMATLNVTISSTNYNDINVDVTVKLIAKSDEALTVTQQNWTYGQNPVAPGFTAPDGSETPVITYSGTANDGSTYGPSATPPTNAGTTYTVTVVCETADAIYTGTADFRIARAIPTGDPAYTKITTNGKTLADANLTKNANWPDGTIVWNDGNTTSVEKNKAYDWTFTPDDENNYTTLSDSIIPYVYHPFNGHAVKLAGDDYGTVDTDASTAKPGETVTVEVKADKGYQLYALEVIDYDGNELKLKENKDGSYSFEMPNSSVTVRAQFVAVGDYKLCPRDYTCPIEPYTDTVNDAWWHDGIHYCVENGLMRGVGEHEFAPGAFTNRQQVWMILARISGENPANMAEARAWAMKTGVSDGTNPTAPITRQQLAAMLYRFAGSPAVKGELRFTDSDKVSAYAVDAVLWCSDKGIVGGYTDGSFKPLDNASRAHIAAMIQRFCVNILGK